tara:strand:+ start:3027 stop:3860 length:834 start_codon:yes stop_codon:yes gene_type:complete
MGCCKKKKVKTQKQDYAQQITDITRAQVKLRPELYEAESEWRPKETQLDIDIAKMSTPQLLDIYDTAQSRLAGMDRRTQREQREADISAIEEFGGRAKSAIDAANPEQAALLSSLNQQAQDDLAMGGDLSSWERRELQQSARAGQAARGMGYGVNDAAIESLAQMQGANARRQQRQGFAQSMVQLNKATQADPFMAILGRPSNVSPAMAGGVVGQARGFNPGATFNPESGFAQALYTNNQRSQLAASQANAANSAARFGAVMGGLGALGGGILSRPS